MRKIEYYSGWESSDFQLNARLCNYYNAEPKGLQETCIFTKNVYSNTFQITDV